VGPIVLARGQRRIIPAVVVEIALGVDRFERLAPEVIPARPGDDAGEQIRRVAKQLERQLREECADAADEVRRRVQRAGGEKPHRIRRLVGDERNQPDQREGEERHAEEFADPPR